MRSADTEHHHCLRRMSLTSSPHATSKSINNTQKPSAGVAQRLLVDFQGMVSSNQPEPCQRAPGLDSLGAHLEAAPAVRLHVSHPADGLDLGLVGSPVVPVLVWPHFKDILVSTVARVLVAHPAETGSRESSGRCSFLLLPL